MRAVLFDSFTEPLHVTDMPEPSAPDDGVVIQVGATGICRSDWHGWQGHDPDILVLPHIPGHEFAGTVTAVGRLVRGSAVGDRVTVPFVCACGACPTCRSGNGQVCPNQWQPGFSGPGSFAERVAIPFADVNVIHLPDAVSDETAAALGCRFATAYRAVTQVAKVQSGEVVVVFGCGGLGLSAVMIAASLGATVIAVDVQPQALSRAAGVGADHLIDARDADPVEVIRDLAPDGAHVGIDALGSAATASASVTALRPRGRHVQVGLLPAAVLGGRESIPMHLVIGRELAVLGSHGMAAHAYPEMLERIASGQLRPTELVARTISLDEVPKALAAMDGNGQDGITVCLP
ncbi:MAG: zinc-dependent alcohol dehydrogenase family protein [Actinobacteria bacterium]|nr:zinc-dependent alcohol dehydrogenase family protein [Actinomycetota bacterium]